LLSLIQQKAVEIELLARLVDRRFICLSLRLN
jgi:hypothetical protein